MHALSLGCAFVCEEAAVDSGHFSIISFILAWTFLSLKIKESHTSGIYINDPIFGSIFFSLRGYISCMLSLGIFLHVKYYASFQWQSDYLLFGILSYLFHLYHNLQLIYIYWHFVELLWLFLHLILYT